MVQATIWEQKEAQRRKDEGINTSYRNSDSVWREAIEDRLREVITTLETFTSDDIIKPVEKRGIFTRTNSALGGIIQGAHRAGLIEPTGYYRESTRPSTHKRPLKIWRVK